MFDEEEESSCESHHSPPQRPGPHYLAKYLLRGSAVVHAVRGNFRSPLSDDVVFGKETSLELVVIDEEGIVQSLFEQPVFGLIKDLAILAWNEKFNESNSQMIGKDILVVLSDSGNLSFLAFSFEMYRFLAVAQINLSKPGNSINQLGRMLAVDPDGCFVAVSAFEDQFALFSVSAFAGGNIIDEKMLYPPENQGETCLVKDTMRTNPRGTIWSICFVSHGMDHSSNGNYPILATIMHRKARLRNELMVFGCNQRARTIQFLSCYPEAEIGSLALGLCCLPHLSGFAILFRIGDALVMNFRDPYRVRCVKRINFGVPSGIDEPDSFEESSRSMDIDDEGMSNVAVCALLELSDSAAVMSKDDDPMGIDGATKTHSSSKHVSAYSLEPGSSSGSNLILCLDSGEIYIVAIHSTAEGITVDLSDCLYRCLPCKELVWVKSGFVIGVVEMGDGFVIQLHDGGVIYRSSIQNISPILDFSVVMDHEEKQTELFACCGMSPMGSLRIISGCLSLEKLVKTPPIYQGITGTWTLRMKKDDPHHSFLVLSFVEETRILSVGLRFFDITDVTGFQPDVCTLACGLMSDGLLVQIHKAGVRLCLPTIAAHIEGIPLSMPSCSSWSPSNLSISSGAVGHNLIVVATSNPCFLYVLGIKSTSAVYPNELYEIHHLRMQHEISCISIPEQEINCEWLSTAIHLIKNEKQDTLCREYGSNPIFVIGTHRPSVEVVSFAHGQGFRFLATVAISVEKSLGTPISSCIPEDVRIVSVDKFYVLVGLRNGMLLRYELPQMSMAAHFAENKQSGPDMVMMGSSVRPSFDNLMELIGGSRPIPLQLIAIRRIGISPVVLVPLRDANDADVIVLSDRPWFLHVARHSLVYTSVSFQPATHATSVCFVDCPNGILFVAENSLHLVELGLGKRLNVPKLSINGTPRKVLYHKEGKTLLILRTGLSGASFSSDICQVDPISGALVSKFTCEPGETAKCMELVKIGYHNLLVVGTSQCSGRTIMPSGEAESTKGRLIVLNLDGTHNAPESSSSLYCPTSSPPFSISSPMHEILGYSSQSSSCLGNSPDCASDDGTKIAENDSWQFKVVYQNQLSGAVLAICAYLNRYIIASAGNTLNVFCFVTDNPLRLLKYSMTKTRFTITSLTTCFTRIAVGDCRDGILFYSFQDDLRKLELLYSDPELRLVADCTLVNVDTAVVSDRRGSISVLSNVNHLEGSESPEKNLLVNCSFYLGESVMRIHKGFFSYKVPVDEAVRESDDADVDHGSPYKTIIASTLLGSLLVLIPVTSEERHLLAAVQARLAVHPLTAPVLGNDLVEFRGRSTQACVPNMLDGDMLTQFLELTITQQEAVLEVNDERIAEPLSQVSLQLSVNQVTKLLERIYHALT